MERFGRRLDRCVEDFVDDETARCCGAVLIRVHHYDGGSQVVDTTSDAVRLPSGCDEVRTSSVDDRR